MFLRQALLAAILVSGSAAAAAAQSDEFPFRRFGNRNRFEFRRDVHPYRFSLRNSERFRIGAERMRMLREHAFAMRDQARRYRMEFRFRGMDRIRDRANRFHFERPKIRMDRFRFDRPMMMRRHSRTI